MTTTAVTAKEQKHISQSFKVDTAQSLTIDVPVGSITMETISGDTVEVNIDIKPKNDKDGDWSLFSSKVDLTEITLDSKVTTNGLTLTIDEDEVKQEWVIRVPAHLATDIDLGVGAIDIENFSNNLTIDVGVGAVSIDLESDNYRSIKLDSGVGDTSIHGLGRNVSQRSHLVGSTTSFSGDGQHTVKVEVGVGEASVTKH